MWRSLNVNLIIVFTMLCTTMAERKNTTFCNTAYKCKSKADEVNSTSFVAHAARLKMQEDYLDKAQAIAIKCMKCLDHHATQDLSAVHKEMECQRIQESEELHHSMLSILNSLNQLRDDIQNEDRLRQLDMEHYRRSIYELENKIRTFSETSDKRFGKLLEEECTLTHDLNNLENKYVDWSQAVKPSLLKLPVRTVSKSYISNTDNIKEEVSTFQTFLQNTGGHTGGWGEEDHCLFLHLRNKHKGKASFLRSLKQHLPDISEEDMMLHEQWYQRYEILKIKQKQAIQKWRTLKNKMNQENNTNSQSVELNLRSKVQYQKDSVEKKQQIEEWKKTLQLKKHLEGKKQWEDKQKELEREEKKRERQALKKLEVECYKEEKHHEQQARMLVKQLRELREIEERVVQANILRKAFRERDQLFVARQLSQREQQTLKKEQRKKQVHIPKEEVNIDRDPERLLKPTAAWRERCNQKTKRDTFSHAVPVLHLRNMPHLQVPTWRRGLT
ncbi:hypothetical protein B7P43_G06189 [Cryptotermes secundus]|uniref:Coiled-coil domain-containing protein 112 n=1 Tax=Cryptotermes secundus TaxID=105785 RepID=A0A2J7QQC0_9NEOP|nr:coiled-coil domain-containing protein 112 isoform X2 [Cryptotermes secundus]PNF30779.1 hypothetical protein B7P43_G06189 [Cryptotermes secundus]